MRVYTRNVHEHTRLRVSSNVLTFVSLCVCCVCYASCGQRLFFVFFAANTRVFLEIILVC